MPFRRRFKDKYAGSSRERIRCPNSVWLVLLHLLLFLFLLLLLYLLLLLFAYSFFFSMSPIFLTPVKILPRAEFIKSIKRLSFERLTLKNPHPDLVWRLVHEPLPTFAGCFSSSSYDPREREGGMGCHLPGRLICVHEQGRIWRWGRGPDIWGHVPFPPQLSGPVCEKLTNIKKNKSRTSRVLWIVFKWHTCFFVQIWPISQKFKSCVMDQRTDGRTDQRTDLWTDGQADGHILL